MRSSVAVRPQRPKRRNGLRHIWVVLVGFVLATGSFLAASVYADRRLERVAQRMHAVSDNAMPSLVQLGDMRRELADVLLALDEGSEGSGLDLAELDRHERAFQAALAAYEALPQFPGEPDVWVRTRPNLDRALVLADLATSEIQAGSLGAADALVTDQLFPAMRAADVGLLETRQINREQGVLAAMETDQAWSNARHVALLFDGLCVAFTAGLASFALLSVRRHEAAEAQRRDELEAFAARVAHDIRAPLSVPLLALQALSRDLDADSRYKPAVERSVHGLKRVDGLVGDLLTFARAGAMCPEAGARAPLRAVVAGVVQDVEVTASAARVCVTVGALPGCEVACSAGVLSSIVGNLVGNAIKYTAGDARVREVTIRATATSERVRVEVADTGAGVPAEVQQKIFEPYVRADARAPGLGLGLATVKRLVETHGGRVGVRSQVGRGSVFWFELPTCT
ncbi:MAG TPA: HAMP domain-containing sensor histidine kinase [Polyangiaceae bacterium]